MTDTNPQQAARRDRYDAAIREAEGWVLDGGQHMLDAVMAVAEAEQAEMRERHHAGLRRADEINNELMQEVQRYAEGREQPVLWSVYNAMHLRADNAEAEAERLRAELAAASTPAFMPTSRAAALTEDADRCAECGHGQGAHEDAEEPVSIGRCTVCADGDEWHNFQAPEELPGLAAAASAPVSPAPADWIDGHPQLEAIAAAVWERCGHHDSGLVIDDPRNIAVAALAAMLPAPADQTAHRDRIVAAIKASPFDELRAVNHAPNGPLQITVTVDDLADTLLHRLAVLPEPTNQAAILREAAAWFDRYDVDSARELRRMAAAASGPGGVAGETRQPCDGCGHAEHPARECPVTLYGERCACDEPIGGETRQDEPVRHAPGKAIRCPDCGAKGYAVCMEPRAAPQPGKEA